MRVVLYDSVLDGHHLEYASYLIEHLSAQGDEITFVTSRPDSRLDSLEAWPAIRLRFVDETGEEGRGRRFLQRFDRTLRGIRRCLNIATREGADIVHHLYLDRAELPALIATAGRWNPGPWRLFATLWWPYFVPGSNPSAAVPKRLYYGMNRLALRHLLMNQRLCKLFVHSVRIRDALLGSWNAPSLRDRIPVVPDPSPSPLRTSSRQSRRRLGLPLEGSILLFFGGLRWDKGPDILFEALPSLEGDWVTVVAGKPERIGIREVEKCRASLRDPARLITRLQFVPDEDVQDYFAAADAVVLPYRRAFKGTSGILQRAAAAGKPVVATDTGEVGPTVRELDLGLVIEPESPQKLVEALAHLAGHRKEIEASIRPRALQYAKESDRRILASRVRDAYLSECGPKPSAPV